MTYLLLKAEQKREGEVRANILHSIQRFMYVSIVFVVVVGGFSIIELVISKPDNKTPEICQEKLERMVKLSKSPIQTVDSLRKLIENSVSPCIEKK